MMDNLCKHANILQYNNNQDEYMTENGELKLENNFQNLGAAHLNIVNISSNHNQQQDKQLDNNKISQNLDNFTGEIPDSQILLQQINSPLEMHDNINKICTIKLQSSYLNDQISSIQNSTSQTQNINSILKILQQISNEKVQDLKLLLAKQLHKHIIDLEDDQFEVEINKEVFNELKQQIGYITNEVQYEILTITETIAKRGTEADLGLDENKFVAHFQQSGLSKAIEDLFLLQIQLLQKGNQKLCNYSEIFLSLLQTFALINQNIQLDNKLLDTIQQFFSAYLSNLTNNLEASFKDINTNGQIIKTLNTEIEKQMIEGSRIIKALQGIAYQENNKLTFVNVFKIHIILSRLFHIQCPQELQCPMNLKIPESKAMFELKAAVFKTFAELMRRDESQYIQQNYQTLKHIAPLIIQFSENQLIQQAQIRQINYSSFQSNQSFCNMSLSITTYSVYLLDSLLFENMKQCEESVNTPGPVNALIQLTKYGKRRTENKINKYDAMYIRQLSNDCLACIRHFGGEQMWNLLIIQYGFIQAQIECVSICGGCEDEYIIANQMRLMNIKYAFDDLRNDMEDKQIKSDLEKVEEEIIEEEGGLEEIDSNKLHTQQLKEDGIYYWANQAMDSVLNTKKDITNEEDE